MKYVVEFYPMNDVHPHITDEDLLLRVESSSPFPVPEVGEEVDILSTRYEAREVIGVDRWVVKRRHFIFWDAGCTTMFWCEPFKSSE